MYKLDQGVTHILLDEAQDTSPGQWNVVEAMLREVVSGEGAHEEPRSFFAVGDKKQSIYSFQGADVSLFAGKEHDLGARLAAVGNYENVPLTLSFRTTEPVLRFVDTLFEEDEAREGVDTSAIKHDVHRRKEAGLVELWPLAPKAEKADINPWDAPVDAPRPSDPTKLLAQEIAVTISDWLKSKKPLPSKGRPIAPSDIMILVQSRGRVFDELIRALGAQRVPIAGADKLKLLEDAAIEDLLSFAAFALTPSDDLALAELLKSPLFGVDEDTLFSIAYDRGGKTLWRTLKEQAQTEKRLSPIVSEIETAIHIAISDGPYAFFSHILEQGTPSGRLRFYRRLGMATKDTIDELLRQALEFETLHPRSLRAFISWFEKNAGEIKRELDRQDDAVRVMTVHGAKGLEANIVFLADAHRAPKTGGQNPLVDLPARSGAGLFAFSTSKDKDCHATTAGRRVAKEKQFEEYRRLLYVAATRARDQLFICGIEQGNQKDPRGKPVDEQNWHSLAHSAFERLDSETETIEDAKWGRPIHRISTRQEAAIDEAEAPPRRAPTTPPAWLFASPDKELQQRRLTPSKLLLEENDFSDSEDRVYSPSLPDRYARGRILHRLLELLPDTPVEEKPEAADRLLTHLAPDVPDTERLKWREEVLTVLNDEQFSAVFAPGSRAEVALAGQLKGDRDEVMVSGQIDRLVVTEDTVLAVDFKTNRPPPQDVRKTPPAYIAQLSAYRALLQQIYPHHKISMALLWTFDARLMPVPEDMLDHTFARDVAPS